MPHTAEIERAREHIWDAERRITTQRRLIAKLTRDGRSTEEAEALLLQLLGILDELHARFKAMTEDDPPG